MKICSACSIKTTNKRTRCIKCGGALNPLAPPEPAWISFHSSISGISYRNTNGSDRQKILWQCREGEDLVLVREPDNPHDKDAVKVLRANGDQLGYLGRGIVGRFGGIARRMDKGFTVQCQLTQVTGGGEKTLGANVEISEWRGTGTPPRTAAARAVAKPRPRNKPTYVEDVEIAVTECPQCGAILVDGEQCPCGLRAPRARKQANTLPTTGRGRGIVMTLLVTVPIVIVFFAMKGC